MKQYILLISFNIYYLSAYAQLNQSFDFYIDDDNEKHLLGKIDRAAFSDTLYSLWFDANYENYQIDDSIISKPTTMAPEDIKIKIFMATWCGDTKRNMPRFLKVIDQLDIKASQIEYYAMDARRDNYKQTHGDHEKGMNIHRVPTFIIEHDNHEVGRIVEHPMNTLEMDLIQILNGYGSDPRYKAVDYINQLHEDQGLDYLIANKEDILAHINDNLRTISVGDLNTYGFVLLNSDRVDLATYVYELNTMLYEDEAMTYNNYAKGLQLQGNHAQSIENYLIALQLNPEYDHIKERIQDMLSDGDTATRTED